MGRVSETGCRVLGLGDSFGAYKTVYHTAGVPVASLCKIYLHLLRVGYFSLMNQTSRIWAHFATWNISWQDTM